MSVWKILQPKTCFLWSLFFSSHQIWVVSLTLNKNNIPIAWYFHHHVSRQGGFVSVICFFFPHFGGLTSITKPNHILNLFKLYPCSLIFMMLFANSFLTNLWCPKGFWSEGVWLKSFRKRNYQQTHLRWVGVDSLCAKVVDVFLYSPQEGREKI